MAEESRDVPGNEAEDKAPLPEVDEEAHEAIRQGIELTRDEQYQQALEIFDKRLPQLSATHPADKRMLVDAFSSYGICVAKIRRKYAQAVQYCTLSLKNNPFDPDHRYNLALVHLERSDRGAAIEALGSGLRLSPNHFRINRILDRLGRRRPPVIPFLPREFPLNVWLGKKLRSNG